PEPPELPELAPVCPAAAGTPVLGDVNGDGRLDVADPIALGNHLYRGGRAPACAAAADFNGDEHVEADDATRLASHVVSGTQHAREFAAGACDSAEPWPEGACRRMGLVWEAPARTTEATFEAALSVRSPEVGIEGWSMSLGAEGCRIVGVTTERTSAAEIWDSPPGLRHLGYAATTTVPEGTVSYVILSFQDDVTLPVQQEPSPILHVTLEADVPESGCRSCSISVGGGLAWRGGAIDLALVADGRTYRPDAPRAEIEVCAPGPST